MQAAGLALVCALVFAQVQAFAQTTIPLTIEPACGPAGAQTQFTGTASGFAPGAVVVWRYFNSIVVGTPPADANGRATFQFTSSATVDIEVSGRDALGRQVQGSGRFVVPCSNITPTSSSSTTSTTTTTVTTVLGPGPGPMTLVCEPPLGPPGFVTTAVGTGFPANVPVTLAWRPGIGGTATVSDAAGGFRVPMLILHHDVLGPRELVATVAAPGGSILARGPDTVVAPFLVVPATLGPPRALDPRLIFRQ